MAKYESNALEYAMKKGYSLIRNGKYYHMENHDSMIFAPNGMWFWNSRGLRGKALDFMVHYEEKTVTEAVLMLVGDLSDEGEVMTQDVTLYNAERAAFALPKKSGSNKRLLAYLCGKRGLEKSVVAEMMRQGLLYEGVTTAGRNFYHNAVFVYRDPSGLAIGAFLRGMSDTAFRGDVEGSKKEHGWLMRGGVAEPDTVYVFEAAIDAASQLSLSRLHGRNEDDADRLSLEGLSPKPLHNYLALHPGIRRIVLMLDNDKWGQRAMARIQEELQSKYAVEVRLPPVGKDWNDALVAEKYGKEQSI